MFKRFTLAVLSAAVPIAGLLVAAAPAPAAPAAITVGSGSPIHMPQPDGQVGACTVAGVGNDKFGNKVALTAGHCGKVGDKVTTASGKPLGTYAASVMNVNGVVQFNKLDYAFIKLNNNVQFKTVTSLAPKGISPNKPTLGQVVCKDGITTGVTCGALLGASRTEGAGYQFTYFGDSGGPVTMNGKLVGVTSRTILVPIITPTMYTFASDIVRDATAKNTVGAGFVQTA